MLATLRHRLHEAFVRWALRVRPPEPAPIVLTQRRVYVLPTRAGLAYATALGVILLGAMNYNLSLGHALVFLLAGLGVVAILHTFRNLVQISIRPGRCEPVFAGSQAQFDVVLENPLHRYLMIKYRTASGKELDCANTNAERVSSKCPVPESGEAIIFSNDEQYGEYSQVVRIAVTRR